MYFYFYLFPAPFYTFVLGSGFLFHLLLVYVTLMHFKYPFRLPSSGVLELLWLLNEPLVR